MSMIIPSDRRKVPQKFLKNMSLINKILRSCIENVIVLFDHKIITKLLWGCHIRREHSMIILRLGNYGM